MNETDRYPSVPGMLAREPVVAARVVGVGATVQASDHPPVTGYLEFERVK